MIFIEFVSPNYPVKGARHYFVGHSIEAVLADTDGGKEFGFATYTSFREATEEEVRSVGIDEMYINNGIESVSQGCLSYWLGTSKS